MITGLYSAASGMVVQMRNQDVLAYNLGNSLIPGFKRESLIIRSFPDVMLQQSYAGIPPSLEQPRYAHAIGRIGTGAGVDWVYTDSSPGQIVYTGNPNDIAIVGDGYLTVLTPDGMRYTRNGTLYRDASGYLSTPEGHYLAGQGQDGYIQPIKISTDRFTVDPYGKVYEVTVGPTGAEVQTPVDQLRIVDFDNRDLLLKEGNNLYALEPGHEGHIIPPRDLRVAQGYIERANCIPTTEMIHLMECMRNFEANSRVLRKIDDTLRRAVNDVGRVG
jgi:flagellar basal-body rod protein FlgG